jgi:hypothetical protein
MQKKNLLPTLLVLGIVFSGLLVFYSRVLLHPNGTMLGSSADAIKNYYTPWYHAKWDSSYTWFEGMNYPYGDHLVFADAQPLLSNAVKIAGLADYTVGIVNYAMLLSLLLAGWLLFRILLRWQVDAWWAALAAAAIALLSPQILKFNAHYGLAYAFVIPLVWHLALRAIGKPSIGRSLTLTLSVFLLGWLHPYYVMISAVFLTAFWGVYSLVCWRETSFWHKVWHFSVQVLLPVLLFTVVLKLTDPVTDRPSNPYGFDQYMATWRSIFLPLTLVGFERFLPAAWKANGNAWEGIGYVGLVAGFAFAAYWLRTAWRLAAHVLGKKLKQFQWIENMETDAETRKLISVSMLAGLLVGLFACGIPFAFKPELMTELFPPIKQFRSLGRFSWVFYYTWATFSFYLLWQVFGWLKSRKLNWAVWVLGGCVVGWTLLEAAAMNRGVQDRIAFANPPMENSDGAKLVLGAPLPSGINLNEGAGWNAIMVLPFFHEGSENFHTPIPQNSRLAFQASIFTGLPMLNVMMSRTSFSQSWSMMQLLTEPQAHLEILDHMPGFHLIYAMRTGYSDTLDGPLVRYDGVARRVGPVEFYDIQFNFKEERVGPGLEQLPAVTYPFSPAIQTSRPAQGLVWDDFEIHGTANRDGDIEGYQMSIGKDIQLKDNNFLHDGPMPFAAGDTVIVSLWVKLRGDRLPLIELGWEEWKGDEKITWHYLSINNSIQRFDGDWALVEREEVIRDPKDRFQVNVTRWKRFPPMTTIDKLLIRKKGTDVYGFENGHPAWKNNRYLPLEMPSSAPDSLGGAD